MRPSRSRSLLSLPIAGAPLKRQRVDVYLPAAALGARGQASGSDTLVLADVPCSIEGLSGHELALARRTLASAAYRVRMYADPAVPLTTKHYLTFGARRLNVGDILNVDELGFELVLLCVEQV